MHDGEGTVAYEEAKSKALRLLSVRSRSVGEMVDRLVSAGFERSVSEQVVERLAQVGLLNDETLAQDETERGLRKGRSRSAIRRALESKGIPAAVIDGVLEDAGLASEPERAFALGVKKAATFRSLDRDTAHRRLSQFLLGRGFDHETVSEVTVRVLCEADRDVDGAWAAG